MSRKRNAHCTCTTDDRRCIPNASRKVSESSRTRRFRSTKLFHELNGLTIKCVCFNDYKRWWWFFNYVLFFLSSFLFKDDGESSLLLSVLMLNANDTLHLSRANITEECNKKNPLRVSFVSSSFWCWLIAHNDYEYDPKCRFLSCLSLCIYIPLLNANGIKSSETSITFFRLILYSNST